MDNDIKTWLYDIMQSLNEIESYFQDQPKLFEDYATDTRTKRAVERNLEIIGEAANRILKKDKNFILTDIYSIIGTRNRIIHGYDTLTDRMIWSIVINNLPKLRKEVSGLLNEK